MQIGSVTLVVPCRNEEKYHPTLFASLDAQKVKGCAMEIIFVDGMSTDCTSAMLAEFAKTRPEVKVLKNPARIVPCAMNLGIRAAVGDLIMRIDANAEYAPDYVAKCLEFSTRTGAENFGGAAPAKGSGYIGKSIGGLWKQNFMNGVWAVYTRAIAPYPLSLRHFVPFVFVTALLVGLIIAVVPILPLTVRLLPLFFIVGSYLTASIFFSLSMTVREGVRYLLMLPVVFATLHFSYGIGSLRGIVTLRQWLAEQDHKFRSNSDRNSRDQNGSLAKKMF